MPEVTLHDESITTVVTHPNWGAIWAGVFTFIAIWSVFGVLGMAVFSSVANPNAAHPVTGMSIGMGIWAIVLTVIAMYVAGRVTGHLAGIGNLRDGAAHGMIMFGLSLVALRVLAGAGGMLDLTAGAFGGMHSAYALGLYSGLGWIGFVALFLGWLAAMGGAASGTNSRAAHLPSQQIRHAA
ncbi:MAG: hypothetical protein WA876_05025 [Candidatus Acidiferrales bacterium]